MNYFRGRAATGTGCILGAATRRGGSTARSRNNVGSRFPWLPGGFGREGRIAALRRLHREPPCAARWWSGEFGRHVARPRNGIGLQANARPARDLRCIPSRPNATPEIVHNTL